MHPSRSLAGGLSDLAMSHSRVIILWALKKTTPRSKFWFCPLLAMWPWACNFHPPSLSFSTHNQTPDKIGGCEDLNQTICVKPQSAWHSLCSKSHFVYLKDQIYDLNNFCFLHCLWRWLEVTHQQWLVLPGEVFTSGPRFRSFLSQMEQYSTGFMIHLRSLTEGCWILFLPFAW